MLLNLLLLVDLVLQILQIPTASALIGTHDVILVEFVLRQLKLLQLFFFCTYLLPGAIDVILDRADPFLHICFMDLAALPDVAAINNIVDLGHIDSVEGQLFLLRQWQIGKDVDLLLLDKIT